MAYLKLFVNNILIGVLMSFVKKQIFPIIKMVLLAVLFTLVFVLIFAMITRWASLDNKVVVPVTYVLKVLSILLACLIAFKRGDNGLIKGLVGGLLYFFISYLLFAALNNFLDAKFNFIDLICLTVSGGIGGGIAVNLFKPKQEKYS